MSYVESNILSGNEKIVLMPEKCKIPLFWHWVFGILFFWLLLIPLIKAIQFHIEFVKTEYAVTDMNVIEKYGWFNIESDEMKLEKIENITVRKTFWGGVFKFGDVNIQGANRNNIHFIGVKDPEMVKRAISKLLDK